MILEWREDQRKFLMINLVFEKWGLKIIYDCLVKNKNINFILLFVYTFVFKNQISFDFDFITKTQCYNCLSFADKEPKNY